MQKVDTLIPIVHRWDNVIDSETCALLCATLLQLKGIKENYDAAKLPWFENDTHTWWQLPDIAIRRLIAQQRSTISQTVSSAFNQTLYPTFTDLSIWRPGKKMDLHKDNGYKNETWLYHRTHTAVIYLNDNYQGGETFIHTPWGNYTSKPQTGSMVAFPSDESALHGVNEIGGGLRFTMPVWFCSDPRHAEDTVYAGSIVL